MSRGIYSKRGGKANAQNNTTNQNNTPHPEHHQDQ
nr:MAG TPA_asm: hypothetical protein [Caudoviricetes sp.]